MLRQLLEEREQLLKQIKLDNEKIKEYKEIIFFNFFGTDNKIEFNPYSTADTSGDTFGIDN